MGKKNRGKGGRRDKYGDMFDYAGGHDDYEDSVNDEEYRYSYQEEIDSAEFIDAEEEEEPDRGSYQNQNSRNDRYEVRSGRDLNESKEKAKAYHSEERDAWNFVQEQAAQRDSVQGISSEEGKKSAAVQKSKESKNVEDGFADTEKEADTPKEPKGPGALARIMSGLTEKVKSVGPSISEKFKKLSRKKNAADAEEMVEGEAAEGETETGTREVAKTESGKKEKTQSSKSTEKGTENVKNAGNGQRGDDSANSGGKSAKKSEDELEEGVEEAKETDGKPKKSLMKDLWTRTVVLPKKTVSGFKNILKRKTKEKAPQDEREENVEAEVQENVSLKKPANTMEKKLPDRGNLKREEETLKREGKMAEAQKETGKTEEKLEFVPGIPSKTPEDLARENRRTYLILGGISVCMCLLLVLAGVLWVLNTSGKTTAKNLEGEQTGTEGSLTQEQNSETLEVPVSSEEKKETQKEVTEEPTGPNFDLLGGKTSNGTDSLESEETPVPDGGEEKISDSDTLAEVLGGNPEKGLDVEANETDIGEESLDSALAELSPESPQIQNAQIESGVETGALDVNSQQTPAEADLGGDLGTEKDLAETDLLGDLENGLAGEATDAGTEMDAGTDLGIDVGTDSGIDAGTDLGIDAGTDSGIDAGMDAGIEADSGEESGADLEKDLNLGGTEDSSNPGEELSALEEPGEVQPGLTLAPTKNTKSIPDEFQTPEGVTSGTNVDGWEGSDDSAKPEAPQEEISWENGPSTEEETGTDLDAVSELETASETETVPGAETPEAAESGLEDGLDLGSLSEGGAQTELNENASALESENESALDELPTLPGAEPSAENPSEMSAETPAGNSLADSLLAPSSLNPEGQNEVGETKNSESADPLAGLESLGADPLEDGTDAGDSLAGDLPTEEALNAEISGQKDGIDSGSDELSNVDEPLDFSADSELEPSKAEELEKSSPGTDSLESLGDLDALNSPVIAPKAQSPKNTQEIPADDSSDTESVKAESHKNYRVAEGDTYWSISEKFYGVPAYKEALARYNMDVVPDANNLTPGTVLLIPELDFLRSCFPTYCPQPAQIMHVPAAESGEKRTIQFYVTAEGDTLSEVAERWLGDASRWPEIYRLNTDKITDFQDIPGGLKLQIPATAPHPESNIWK